jgi:hypothetical protein
LRFRACPEAFFFPLTGDQRGPHILHVQPLRARLLIADAYVAALESLVDAAFESHDCMAEELDAELAAARERYGEIEAECVEFETFSEFEPPDYHEGVSIEEELLAAYAHWSAPDPRGPFAGERSAIVGHMRAALANAARHPIDASDDDILDAARDLYESARARTARRQCKRLRV